MKYIATAFAVLAMSGTAALAQIAHHDDGSTTVGAPVSGPVGISGGFNPRGGGIVYSANTETGSRANGGAAAFTGAGVPADPSRALFDDVPISNALLGGMTELEVCRVTVGIRRLAGAPATDVNVFWSTITTEVTAPDTQLDTPPSALGTISLPAAAATITELVTFGASGGPALFTVPLNTTIFDTFGTFSIGVSLSSTDSLNGWRITNGPSVNAQGLFWLYDPNHTGQATDEGAYSFGTTTPSQFYIVVEGTPVPAPFAAAPILALAGAFAARRRR